MDKIIEEKIAAIEEIEEVRNIANVSAQMPITERPIFKSRASKTASVVATPLPPLKFR